jgi:hypothetical protein
LDWLNLKIGLLAVQRVLATSQQNPIDAPAYHSPTRFDAGVSVSQVSWCPSAPGIGPIPFLEAMKPYLIEYDDEN